MADANLHRVVQTTAFELSATPGYKWYGATTAFDVKCAADAEDQCNIFTSPFLDWVPQFPRISAQEIITYSDGLWGPQEYTRWPQLYNERCLHHACIPTSDAEFAPGAQVYEGFGYSPWEESISCGVPGFGFLKPEVLNELYSIATDVLQRYDAAERNTMKRDALLFNRESGIHHRLGKMLSILLRNAVDRLRMLPTTEQHALVTGRMAHRLILELSGLTVFYNEVVIRMASPISHHPWVLPVLGAFVRTDAAAQLFYRLGLPFWHIRPWSRVMKIAQVVSPRHWSNILNDTPAWPRVPKSWYDPDGTHQDPGRWTHPSVVFVCNMTCSSALPHLQAVSRAEGAEAEAKRFKGNDAAVPLLPPPQKPHAGRNATKRGKRGRSKRGGAKPQKEHAATTFKRPPEGVVTMSPNWRAALSSAPPLAFPPPVALEYYYPPPFLILEAQNHKTRYLHNFVRIRKFCRLRLVDSRINGAPLRIADWRHALFGDYRVDDDDRVSAIHGEPADTGEVGEVEEGNIVEENQAGGPRPVRPRGSLLSYRESEATSYRGLEVSVDVARSDPSLLNLVVWELFETNWQCELRALDTRLVDLTGNSFRHWEREQQLANVWRGSALQSALSVVDVGSPFFCWTPAGQEGWKARRANLQAFLYVLSAWPDFPHYSVVPTRY
ncbi:uncharacterized protein B0H18DRAFT_1130414 [Fomitopsis serialis]|uniref:uncharacterized protein n=1 Tax=Fomitopsis serialis TaxID=139415 RepID=UPI00200869EF|nr:uncharacterized protein B0H18DRAFT_1130414 [Neoantrodia serialis]KAH9910277.1 hypothetical protein B0H18DRAFT_1130414 [Neoantrodia serialis]